MTHPLIALLHDDQTIRHGGLVLNSAEEGFLHIALVNSTTKLARFKQLNDFILDCLQLPCEADDQAIRAALQQRQDNLYYWYENRRREIGKRE